MIIQKVLKGIGGIDLDVVNHILEVGLVCQWWREVNPLPQNEIPQRLTDRNLVWHQNYYDQPDPIEGNRPFYLRTPFISTTAGTIERDVFLQANVMHPAWVEALRFATNMWTTDGYLFFCHVFVIGKKSVGHQLFSEELRELNTYSGYSPFQPEGEILAKIVIPPAQIEKVEFWSLDSFMNDIANGQMPTPTQTIPSPLYLPPEDYANVRDVIG